MTYKHVQTIRSVVGGVETVYRYHRKAKVRLISEPGTDAFAEEYARIEGELVPQQKQRPTQYVYFIRSDECGPVKIGKAIDPILRLRKLRPLCPYPVRIVGVIPDPEDTLERELHKKFSYARLHGEWFRPDMALLAYIEEHAGAPIRRNAAETVLQTSLRSDWKSR